MTIILCDFCGVQVALNTTATYSIQMHIAPPYPEFKTYALCGECYSKARKALSDLELKK